MSAALRAQIEALTGPSMKRSFKLQCEAAAVISAEPGSVADLARIAGRLAALLAAHPDMDQWTRGITHEQMSLARRRARNLRRAAESARDLRSKRRWEASMRRHAR